MEERSEFKAGLQIADICWGGVGIGYIIGLSITVVVGIPLFVIAESAWLLAAAGLGGLLIGGFAVGRRVGARIALINGALTAVLYYLTVALAYLAASFLELLPEPLPGLPQGDSTFFFAWPLAQFVVGVTSAMIGSRFADQHVEGEG